MQKLKGQNGLSVLDAVLAILLVVTIGLAGYFAYQSHHNKTASSGSTTVSSSKAASAPATSATAGWKSYCDTATGACFKYPAEWGETMPLEAQGVTAFVQNKEATINVEYSASVDGSGGLGSFVTHSLSQLATANGSYKVVGGYYGTGSIPGYRIVDTSLVQQYGLSAGKTSNIPNANDLFFTKGSSKATLVVHYNNTTGSPSIATAQANDWFSSADGKTALLIAQSFYTQ